MKRFSRLGDGSLGLDQIRTVQRIRFSAGSAHRQGRSGRNLQGQAALANPTRLPRWNSKHQGVIGDVFGHYSTRANKGISPDCSSADNRRISTQSRTLFHHGAPVFRLPAEVASGRGHVCEDHGRAAENVVFQFHTIVERHIVLNLNVIANPHARGHVNVLPKIAFAADSRVRHHVGKVPNLCSLAYLAGFVNEGG